MNPAKFAQMMKYLTRVKEQKPDLPDVFLRDNSIGKADGGRIEFDKGGNPKIIKKITDSVNQYNKILTDAMTKKDISKIPTFLSYIKKKHPKFTNSTVNNYLSRDMVKVKPLSRDIEKRKLLNQLVDEANAKLKHTKWLDIEKKVQILKEEKVKEELKQECIENT